MDPPLREAPSPKVHTTAPTGAGLADSRKVVGIPVTGMPGVTERVPRPLGLQGQGAEEREGDEEVSHGAAPQYEMFRRIDTWLSLAMATAVGGLLPAAPPGPGPPGPVRGYSGP